MIIDFNKVFEKICSDKFLASSFVFLTGGLLAGAGNYVFHFLMARMLSVEDYGGLQSLIATFTVFSIPIATLATVLIQYVAQFRARAQLKKIHQLFSFFTKKILIVAAGFFVIFFLLNQYIANFLNLDSGLAVMILGLSFLPGFLGFVNRGIIQGLEKFKSASVIGVVEVFSKVLLAVFLVRAGFGVNGAIAATASAFLISYLIGFLPVKFLFKKEKEKINTQEIFQYFFPVLFFVLSLSLLFNLDMILVKHFMVAKLAGEYAALELMGHIIFFVCGPITEVMFPMAVRARAEKVDPGRVFKKSLALILLLAGGTLTFYFLFPDFVIKILVGSKFLAVSRVLGWYGIAMFFYSFVHLLSAYFLSLGQTRAGFIVGAGVLLQTILISLWHQSIWQIIWIMNGVMFMLLICLAAYFMTVTKLRSMNYGR